MNRPTLQVSAVTLLVILGGFSNSRTAQKTLPYAIVDTGVTRFFDNNSVIEAPKPGDPFYGQDAQFQINPPSYKENGDGTVTDLVTGLIWQQKLDEKMSFEEAFTYAKQCSLGGHKDWRVPSIKELYSLILFTGKVSGPRAIQPFIDTRYFEQPLGKPELREREIDAQTWSTTQYVGTTMRGDETVFGVNFVDGRIKGYPRYHPRTGEPNQLYVRLVRGNAYYGQNQFNDNGDGTVTDKATGLMWQKADSGTGMDWKAALACAHSLRLAGFDDWRLPDAKELQSIVDYSRSIQTTHSAAIDPIFQVTEIRDPEGNRDFPYFWTSTTHHDGRNIYESAVYIAFGSAFGKMGNQQVDAHGAGAQRSDPKTGNPDRFPQYFGPQGDLRNVFNFVRCVRTVKP
ncbi:MAG: DUF1566 domain-containing protein [Verrucomicrobiae bacterium]|nr:DUF1566 domain-containing protein [Verrucomicrobiae bacterium]